jgi:hypothetical protein
MNSLKSYNKYNTEQSPSNGTATIPLDLDRDWKVKKGCGPTVAVLEFLFVSFFVAGGYSSSILAQNRV